MKNFFLHRKTPKLGQHLLTSDAIARAVRDAVALTETDTVLEIGPGKGMLTRELLAVSAQVVAIEKDPEMVRALQETFVEEIVSKKLILIEDDIRNLPDLITHHSSLFTGSYKVVANIPYYITGEIIRLLLTAPHQPTDISLLVQKEVAERIARSRKESLLSLSVKAYGAPQYVRTVLRGSFNPPPSVDSAILAIRQISRKNFEGVSEKTFFEILHLGFGQKRKTLLGNLKRGLIKEGSGHTEAGLKEIFTKLGIDEKARAEDLPLTSWLILAKRLL